MFERQLSINFVQQTVPYAQRRPVPLQLYMSAITVAEFKLLTSQSTIFMERYHSNYKKLSPIFVNNFRLKNNRFRSTEMETTYIMRWSDKLLAEIQRSEWLVCWNWMRTSYKCACESLCIIYVFLVHIRPYNRHGNWIVFADSLAKIYSINFWKRNEISPKHLYDLC